MILTRRFVNIAGQFFKSTFGKNSVLTFQILFGKNFTLTIVQNSNLDCRYLFERRF